MAGYIGSKSSVTQVDGYNQAEADAEFVNDPNSVITVSGSNVGINTSSPRSALDIDGGVDTHIRMQTNSTGSSSLDGLLLGLDGSPNALAYFWNYENAPVIVGTNNAERMRIDSSGNLLVGATSSTGIGNGTNEGISISSSQKQIIVGTDSDVSLYLNRQSSDGTIAEFRKDGTTVGSIGNSSTNFIVEATASNRTGLNFGGSITPRYGGANADAQVDLGNIYNRFDDIYATNGTIQTSDRNEKQDIEALSDAEQRVAVACKGLLRKFRWQDAVAEKGDDARIHFGIIAQDLQDAFAAEGLDAGRYAMFISSTWWETQTEVPAVEAVAEVLDDDGNVVTEAVEAKEAYTRTDTYETQAEAPEGATERTRLGVRYPELLAFIIGAM